MNIMDSVILLEDVNSYDSINSSFFMKRQLIAFFYEG